MRKTLLLLVLLSIINITYAEKWELFNTDNSPLTENNLFGLFFQSNGALWITYNGTSPYYSTTGITRFYNDNWTNYNGFNKTSEMSIQSKHLAEDSDGNLYIAYGTEAIQIFEDESWQKTEIEFDFSKFKTGDYLSVNEFEILGLEIINNNEFYLIFHRRNFDLVWPPGVSFEIHKDYIYRYKEGVWDIKGQFSIGESIGTFQKKDNEFYYSGTHIHESIRKHSLYVCHSNDEITEIDLPVNFRQDGWLGASCLGKDNELWFLGSSDGILKYDNNSWEIFKPEWTFDGIEDIIEADLRGNLWIYQRKIIGWGEWEPYIIKFNPNSGEYIKYNQKLKEYGITSIKSIAVDKHNNIWFATDKGLLKLTENQTSTENTVKSSNYLSTYPNPFSQFQIMNYELREAGHVTLKLYDLMGNELATLVDGFMPAGRHEARFDAAGLPEGMYILKLQAGGEVVTRKVVKF